MFLVAVALVGCHTSKPSVTARSRRPVFIDDIYMGGRNKNNQTADAIDKSTRYPDKPAPDKNHRSAFARPAPKPGPAANPDEDRSRDYKVSMNPFYKPGDANAVKEKYAEVLGVSQKDMSNHQLYTFIDDWYGACYRRGGCEKDGIDCSGFVQKLYTSVFGQELPRTSREQFDNCTRIKKGSQPDEGDLVFFKIRSKHITHVGVYLMNDYFVHASSSQGIVISNLNDGYWHKYFAGAGKVRKG